MTLRKLHYLSGMTITVFIGLHLFNHFCSIFGVEKHIEIMNSFRHVYRHKLVEPVLLLAVLVQIASGLTLFSNSRKMAASRFDKLQIWSGLYLAFFLIIHLSAVFVGRLFLHLDTNFYFGVAGINSFPANLFFIPYYGFAIISFFGHLAAAHNKKMKQDLFNLTPDKQAKAILLFGVILTLILFYGLTNQFKGVAIPEEYEVLVGK